MKKTTYILSLIVATVMVMTAGIAAAATATAKDEAKLTAEITMLNADAKLPQGEKMISKQLTDSFSVKSDKISSLLSKNMQYGEVAAILAFADKMPGGVTDANINQVQNLRQTKAGWTQISRNLKVDLSDVASKLSGIEDDAHKDIKQALSESPSGRGAGGGESTGDMTGETGGEMPGGATGGTGTDMSGGATGGTGTDSGMPGGGTGGYDGGSSGGGGY
jgi:hypothetical protein